MPLLSPRRRHHVTYRAIATVVALSLLSMPVTYRGGAATAHAHTIFQLWEDVRIGSFTHHAPDEASEPPRLEIAGDGHGAVDHSAGGDRDQAIGSVAADHDARISLVDDAAPELVRGSPPGMVEATVEPDVDAPLASSAFTPSVRGTVLVLPSAATWPQAESVVSAGRQALRPSGITDSPATPPPRRPA